jgi:hypothetical protein
MFGKPKDNLTQSDRVPSLVQQLQRTPIATSEALNNGSNTYRAFGHRGGLVDSCHRTEKCGIFATGDFS